MAMTGADRVPLWALALMWARTLTPPTWIDWGMLALGAVTLSRHDDGWWWTAVGALIVASVFLAVYWRRTMLMLDANGRKRRALLTLMEMSGGAHDGERVLVPIVGGLRPMMLAAEDDDGNESWYVWSADGGYRHDPTLDVTR